MMDMRLVLTETLPARCHPDRHGEMGHEKCKGDTEMWITFITAAVLLSGAHQVKPDERLAGLWLDMSLKQVLHFLGPPVQVIDTPDTKSTWRAGERHYRFVNNDMSYIVYEEYYQQLTMKSEHSSGAEYIEIRGRPRHHQTIGTGRGLMLGDTLSRVRHIYGKVSINNHFIQCDISDGIVLELKLDTKDNIVTGISIHRSEE